MVQTDERKIEVPTLVIVKYCQSHFYCLFFFKLCTSPGISKSGADDWVIRLTSLIKREVLIFIYIESIACA